MKVLLFAYTKVNLGDNLFIYILLKKYPQIDFYIHILEEEYKKVYEKFKNIHFLYEERNLERIKVKEYDAFIYVGGSIFIESEYGMREIEDFNRFIKKCKENNKKFFYMSCNFGPFKTDKFLDVAKENFSICDGICFREINSYNRFKDIKKVRYSPDMAFTFKNKKISKEKKSIGISIVDLLIRDDLKQYINEYNDFIKRIIIKFAKRGYKVYLFSFSQFEKDDVAIERILNIVPEVYKDKIKTIKFDCNIEKYLEQYGKMEYMICARFHSMILSMLYGQKVYNITYSKKQDNVINELKLFKRYQPINKITYDTILRKYYFKKVSSNNIKKIAQKAEGQFEDFNKWLQTEQ